MNVMLLISNNEVYQHLEDLYNSVYKYFPRDKCMKLQNQVWVKNKNAKYNRGFNLAVLKVH